MTAIAIALAASPAHAFTLETPASEGCHEQITRGAVEESGWPHGLIPPAPTADDATLLGAVLFSDATDLWDVALVSGVRDSDLGPGGLLALDELSAIHNGHDRQAEHCLRAPEDDGPLGDVLALSNCRAVILRELALAHGESDRIDPSETAPVAIALKFHTAEVQLSRYSFHMGRALHAMQDAFSHTFRTEDVRRVVAVFNYVDPAISASFDPSRDGPPHSSEQDHCAAEDAHVIAAKAASAELVRSFSGYETREERFAAAEAVLEKWLGHSPGCTAENAWCGRAAESSGCAATGGIPAGWALLALLGARRREIRGRSPIASASLLVAVCSVISATPARAEPRPMAIRASTAVALDRGGGAIALGAQLRLSPLITVGADLEYNPWFDVQSLTAAPGAANASGALRLVWGRPSGWEIQTELRLGASVLLFDLPGARAGAVGVFVGFSPVRVVVPLSPRSALELSPDLAVAIPSLGGVPLAYRQYRLAVAMRWDI